MINRDEKVIEDFGDEWTKFNYSDFDPEELERSFEEYFDIFPWDMISEKSIGFDMGCGSGRWAQFIAPKVKKLNCIEPSEAIKVAKYKLKSLKNVAFLKETTQTCSLQKGSQDFGYSLGVLHHIPDTDLALSDCAKLLKRGAPFLLYLYYNFENKPIWFKSLWRLSNILRLAISRLPSLPKKLVCNVIAYTIYFPLSRLAYLLEIFGLDVSNIPLSAYRSKPFYQSKNDALDRFGTRLEQRFSKADISNMLIKNGFENVKFSESEPYWCCIAFKR